MTAALSRDEITTINQPIGNASGLPNRAYTSKEFFELERDALFSNNWTCIGHACSMAQAGDVLPIDLMGIPLVALRNTKDEIKVFHNVCSHRGNQLVWEACSGKKVITCPYHAWSYDLKGNLVGTPHIGGYGKHQAEGFDKAKHGLCEVRSFVWMDLVFINLAENQPDFDEYIRPLEERVFTLAAREEFERLKPATSHGTLELNLSSNWKLCIENNLESYHLPWVHPDLNSISKLEDHYHFYIDDLCAGQGSETYDPDRDGLVEFPKYTNWCDRKAEYPTLFPNVFLGFQYDHFWSIVIEPIAPNRTREKLQLYYLSDGAQRDEYEPTRKSQLESWTKVFNEDVGVVEGMHRGRGSPAFNGGVFSPEMDKPTHFFHKWVARKMAV